MDRIIFSIIIPVYNREKVITSSIMSVFNQQFTGDYEIIAVDDGSTDNTLSILQGIANTNKKLKVIHQENEGVSSARNAGLKIAKGQYVLFLDSDDQLVENSLNVLYETIVKNSVDLIIFGIVNAWKPDTCDCGKILQKSFIRDHILKEHVNAIPQTRRFFTQPFVVNKCYSLNLIKSQNIEFDVSRKTWEDNVFLVDCFDKADCLVMIPDELYHISCIAEVENHLSRQFFPEMIDQYLLRYEENKLKFGKEINFNNQYTIRRYYEVTCSLFDQMLDRADGKEIFIKTFNNKIWKHILKRLEPKNSFESLMKKASIKQKNLHILYRLYLYKNKRRYVKYFICKFNFIVKSL